jgi:hypothetical protein
MLRTSLGPCQHQFPGNLVGSQDGRVAAGHPVALITTKETSRRENLNDDETHTRVRGEAGAVWRFVGRGSGFRPLATRPAEHESPRRCDRHDADCSQPGRTRAKHQRLGLRNGRRRRDRPGRERADGLPSRSCRGQGRLVPHAGAASRQLQGHSQACRWLDRRPRRCRRQRRHGYPGQLQRCRRGHDQRSDRDRRARREPDRRLVGGVRDDSLRRHAREDSGRTRPDFRSTAGSRHRARRHRVRRRQPGVVRRCLGRRERLLRERFQRHELVPQPELLEDSVRRNLRAAGEDGRLRRGIRAFARRRRQPDDQARHERIPVGLEPVFHARLDAFQDEKRQPLQSARAELFRQGPSTPRKRPPSGRRTSGLAARSSRTSCLPSR